MKKKQTYRALLMSALSLLLCLSMLVGTTFAWFTDSVTSGVNTIAAGNLDVELYHGKTQDPTDKVNTETLLFTDASGKEIKLWEPGVVAFTNLKVANVGTLALKYQLSVNSTKMNTVKGSNLTLEDALKVAVVKGGVTGDRAAVITAGDAAGWDGLKTFNLPGVLDANETSDAYGIVIYWQPSAEDNLFNMNNNKETSDGQSLSITLGVNLFATQQTAESDSFDDQYDNITAVSTEAELKAALEAGGNVLVAADIDLTETITIPSDKTAKLDLNGKTITAPTGAICAIQNLGTLTVTGNGNIKGSYTALYSNGNLTIEGGTFTATDGFGVIIDNIYGTEASVAVINGGIFTGVGIYNPADVTINGGTFNVGRDPDGATDHLSDEMALFISPTFVGAPNTAKVVLNGGTVNGDVYVYDDGITETVFINNGATIAGDVLDNG